MNNSSIIKTLLVILLTVFTTSSLAKNKYLRNNIDDVIKCVKIAKSSCNITTQKIASRIVNTCKLLSNHSQDVIQIKSSKSCIRKLR